MFQQIYLGTNILESIALVATGLLSLPHCFFVGVSTKLLLSTYLFAF